MVKVEIENKKNTRVKREDCSRTKHDELFSHWKILIGPDDWYEYSYNKNGTQRYRIHNLPDNFPGLYELGITKSHIGTKTRIHDIDDIMVVYLGQADNVRTRLQHYGRTGSHLECGKPDPGFGIKGNEIPVKEGPGLFREIFSRGCSIVYRCAMMKNKLEAEKREEQLLEYFDYAWNQIHNGFCRRDEILSKLQKSPSINQTSLILKKLHNWKNIIFRENTPGIRIDRRVSSDKYLVPEVRKFFSSRPQLVEMGSDVNLQRTPLDENICGIVLGDGGLCAKNPVQGRKRCEEHKGRRIVETKVERFEKSNGDICKIERFVKNNGDGCKIEEELGGSICGASEFDGSICKNAPVKGRKRCALHKGRRMGSKQVPVLV